MSEYSYRGGKYTEEEIQAVVDLAKSGAANGASAWGQVAEDGSLVSGLNIASTSADGPSNASYTVVFATPMPDANYSVVIGCENNVNGRQATIYDSAQSTGLAKTANGFSYYTQDLASPANEPAAVNFAVFATTFNSGTSFFVVVIAAFEMINVFI